MHTYSFVNVGIFSVGNFVSRFSPKSLKLMEVRSIRGSFAS